ncbi:hypothetical protein QCA50_003708 [Cerrena zonata]|uniref:Uncharacterized protein n=1 Tax=Cerrena zonata TaxID=2478898 RepID=A0AAW0GNA1_9APHY
MALFGLRKWPVPVLTSLDSYSTRAQTFVLQVAKPLWPFFAASAITYYLVSKAQDAGVKSEEFRNDPRNPYAAQIAKENSHH